ncbi:hypothetical protein ACWTU6_30600 [Mesorhizobium sp. BHbsci]
MQPLKFDDPFSELTVLRLQRSNARRQLFSSRFAGSIHQILESKACRRVNRKIRELSACDLILPHRMADDCVNIDAVENPVQLLGHKLDDRSLPASPEPKPQGC